MAGSVKIEEGPFEADHPRCLECNRPLKNPRWRKIGRGKKCYAKHCQELVSADDDTYQKQSLTVDADTYGSSPPLIVEPTQKQIEQIEQDRASKVSKAEKRAALDAAFQDELAKKNPEPTEAQKAAEQRLLQDVDRALGVEENGREDEEAADPADSAGEEDKERTGKKKRVKAPKGQAIVRAGSFNRGSRSIEVERNV